MEPGIPLKVSETFPARAHGGKQGGAGECRAGFERMFHA
jgi:hypothetical protein